MNTNTKYDKVWQLSELPQMQPFTICGLWYTLPAGSLICMEISSRRRG